MKATRNKAERAGRAAGGFTLVELLVSMTIMTVALFITLTVFKTGQRTTRRATVAAGSQQNARVASARITKDLRSIGFEVDVGRGQQALVHAGPWDLIFNANISPASDDPMDPGAPNAIDLGRQPAAAPADGNLYVPEASYLTGAETYRYTLDSTGDGSVNLSDRSDDAEEDTRNPYDYLLIREVYGAGEDGTNGGVAEPIALVHGPVLSHGEPETYPLFTYWIDDDEDPQTLEILHGDTNYSGFLEPAEIPHVLPVDEAELPLVMRIIVSPIGADKDPDFHGNYSTRTLKTAITFRNQNRRKAVIYGQVFEDSDGDGVFDLGEEEPLSSIGIILDAGVGSRSNVDGEVSFEVDPGDYQITEIVPEGMEATTPTDVAVEVAIGGVVRVEFGLR